MSLNRLLPFLMLVPAMVFAGNDRMFQISPDYFKDDFLLEKDDKLAIVHEGLNSISSIPELPLHAHTMYLRHKRGPKDFYWYVGQVDDEKFGKLHAFSIKDNLLKPSEVIYLRFYGSKKHKAFQDETDIYFDKEYIYSSRIATLYFMRNGRWEMLKETDRPSIINIDTSITDLQVTSLTKRLKRKVSKIYPVKPGLYAFDFAAPGYLPYVDAVNVTKSEAVTVSPLMPVLEKDSVASAATSLNLDSVASVSSLEAAEIMFDKFTSEVKPTVSLVDTNVFDSVYPKQKTAAELGVAEDAPEYIAYAEQYLARRNSSRDLWRNNKLGLVGEVNRALIQKLDSLQGQPLSGMMVPEKIEPVLESVAESEEKKISAIRLTFGKEKNRFDVSWIGNAAGIVPDTLFAILDAASSVQAHLSLTNNKPVWIYDNEGLLIGRHHYRYSQLDLIIDDQVYPCQGEFKLPPYIAAQQEVRSWLGATTTVIDTVKVDSVTSAVADSALAVDSAKAELAPVAVADSVAAVVADTTAVAAVDSVVAPAADSAKTESVAMDAAVAETATADSSTADSAVVADTAIADSSAVTEQAEVAEKEVVAEKAPADDQVLAERHTVKVTTSRVIEYDDDEIPVDVSYAPKIIEDAIHGTVVLLDSGSFRYKGKVVSMSPFAIHTTEVTQLFYQEAMDRRKDSDRKIDKSRYSNAQKPVHDITWYEAQEFCKSIGGDLPTEAQWEFAGRADNNEGALWNLDEEPNASHYAIYRENSYNFGKGNPNYGPQPVASRKPNAWGIYDMSGNVAEWTKDKYFMFSFIVEDSNPTGAMMGSHKVYKGGSWKDSEKHLNLTKYDDDDPRYWSDHIGFRCAFPRSVFEGK